MKTLATSLPGALVIELDEHVDARGRFVETYRASAYAAAGIDARFVQDNLSTSVRGTLRGLHFQAAPHAQGKLVWVTRGAIFDVVADVQRESSTFGKWAGTMLSAENRRQLWIPPGYAHGFYALSEHADVAYKTTAEYAKDAERSVRWDDPDLAIAWPLDGAPLISPKDERAPSLRELTRGA